jgi:DNA-binding beta-propeller fold protein YncE
VEIDPVKNTIIKRHELPADRCAGNHGLLIDPQKRRAFIACEDSASLLLLDMKAMKVVKSWTIGKDPDVLALDTKTNRLFVAAESGIVSIFSNGHGVMPVAQAFFAPAAHTVAVDSKTRLVYFPLENVGGKPLLRIVAER